MNYAEIKTYDVANGPGIRVSLFVSGCTHKCKGCFNEEAWDFDYGEPFTDEVLQKLIDAASFGAYRGLTFLGGEPLDPQNQADVLKTAKAFKEAYPDKDIWLFSGYTYEYIMKEMVGKLPETEEILSLLDVLVDGPFIEEQKNLMLLFRGSENQRLINVPETLKSGKIVEWEREI
ncbi:MAG: anaerobic ribonucleoside-triphosphate reductase activating protein [Eubacterium sp.]|nr:anaerobic ribonucleoside-triphosphate reductase activating protein [Eubacterium sp.]